MAVDMKMNVLIVDDYKTMLRIVGNLLKQLGFSNIDEATDGATALEKLRQKNYGGTAEQVQDAVRIAAVIHAVALTLDSTPLLLLEEAAPVLPSKAG